MPASMGQKLHANLEFILVRTNSMAGPARIQRHLIIPCTPVIAYPNLKYHNKPKEKVNFIEIEQRKPKSCSPKITLKSPPKDELTAI